MILTARIEWCLLKSASELSTLRPFLVAEKFPNLFYVASIQQRLMNRPNELATRRVFIYKKTAFILGWPWLLCLLLCRRLPMAFPNFEKTRFLKITSLRFWHFVHNVDREGTVPKMRSKLLVWGYLCVLSLATVLNLYIPKTEAVAKESIVIPGEAIRLRILANSDFEEDQRIKRKVRDAVNAKVELWVKDLTSMEKARKVIKAKLPEIQAIAEKTVKEQGSHQSVKVEFRKVQFPTKLYGQFLYPAGKYQAILITLGKGEGANWWCVLYPPLCFLDFSNGVAVSSDGFEEKEAAVTKDDGKNKIAKTTEQAVKDDGKNHVAEESQDQTESKAKEKPGHNEEKAAEEKSNHNDKKTDSKKQKKTDTTAKKAPVYTKDDEQPVKVKFFVAELWKKIF